MAKRIENVQGLFGQTIHYEDGVKVGESWPGLFGGSSNHYDASGNFAGSSETGLFADQIHRDSHGNVVGESCRGLFGQTNHYDEHGSFEGASWNTLTGSRTDLDDSAFDPFAPPDDF